MSVIIVKNCAYYHYTLKKLENYQNIKPYLLKKEECIFISLTFSVDYISKKLDENQIILFFKFASYSIIRPNKLNKL